MNEARNAYPVPKEYIIYSLSPVTKKHTGTVNCCNE